MVERLNGLYSDRRDRERDREGNWSVTDFQRAGREACSHVLTSKGKGEVIATDNTIFECSNCGARYKGQLVYKHSLKVGEARIIRKKVRIGSQWLTLREPDNGFTCPACGFEIKT